jgi:hypothetical protein
VFRAFAYSSDAIKQVEFSPGLPVFIGRKRFVHFHGNEAPPRDRIDVNQAPAAGKPRRRNSAADAEVPEGVPLIEEVGFATDSPLERDSNPRSPIASSSLISDIPATPFVVAGTNPHHDFARPPISLLVRGKSLSSIPTATMGAANPYDAAPSWHL